MTAAKPAAEIMMKPMRDIMRTPWVKDDAATGEDDEAGQRPQHDAVGHQLQPQRHGDGQQGDPDVVEVEIDRLRLGGQDLLQIILARLAVAEEDGDEQAEEHAEYRDGHRQGQLAVFHRYAVVDEVLGQDVVEEDAAKAHRQQHIGRGQAKGDDAGHLTAVDLHLGHDVQQRRDQDGNEGDVHRDQVLGGDGDREYRGEQQALDPENAGAAGILAELVDDLAGQQIGDAGAGDGDREGPQHGVGEGDLGAATQATAEGAEGLLEGETANQAADDGADGERDHHIDPQQAEHQHQRHRDNNRIHLLSL